MDHKEILLKQGVFMLSLDTELCWGVVDKPKKLLKNKKYYEDTREVIDKILTLMEMYNISATWAVVGHLFLNQCEDSKYKNIDPQLWCGEDIIKKILSCKVYQEIGCHSYSHLIFGDVNTKRETVSIEMERCIEVGNNAGIKLESFVFPRNSIGYLDELKNNGFRVYRDVEPSWYRKFNPKIRKVCHIVDQTLAITPPVGNPVNIDGLIGIPGSMQYLPMNGFRKYIPIGSRIRKAKKGINKAIQDNKIFHLWFHPFNIATNKEKLLFGLEEIFRMVDNERKKGNIHISTMNQIIHLSN